MANINPKKAEPLSSSEIRAYAEQLDEMVRLLRRAEVEALKQPNQSLNTFGIASGRAGIDRLRTFVNHLDRSRYEAATGRPIQEGAGLNKQLQDWERD